MHLHWGWRWKHGNLNKHTHLGGPYLHMAFYLQASLITAYYENWYSYWVALCKVYTSAAVVYTCAGMHVYAHTLILLSSPLAKSYSNFDFFMSHHLSNSWLWFIPPYLVSPFQPLDSTGGNPPSSLHTESEEFIGIRSSQNTTKLNQRMLPFERERQGERVLRKRSRYNK